MRPTIYRQFAGFSLLTVRLMPRADFGDLRRAQVESLSRAVHGVKLFVCRSPSTLSKPRPVGGVSNGLTIRYLLFAFCLLFLSSCTYAIPRLGMGGRYEEGKDQFLRGRGGDMDRAIIALESVVKENPTYRDSLTLLGRAYYRKGRYDVARQLLERAVTFVNKDDEIAWLALGLTQLRLGDDEKGLETMKGAITLVSKVATSGYRDYLYWDRNGLVRTAIRRTVHLATKGLEEKEELIRNAEALLARIDEEENYQRNELPQQRRRDYGAG